MHRAFLREALESPWVVWSAFIDCPKPIACTVGIASRRTRDLRSSQLLAGALPCPPPPQCPCQRALARRPTMTTRLELTGLQDPGGMKQGSDLAVGRRPLATLSVRAEKGFLTSFLTSKLLLLRRTSAVLYPSYACTRPFMSVCCGGMAASPMINDDTPIQPGGRR